jgi:hypothetical protein
MNYFADPHDMKVMVAHCAARWTSSNIAGASRRARGTPPALARKHRYQRAH